MTETASTTKPEFPKLHNAMWSGQVGKGPGNNESCIDLDTMLDMTAKAEVNGVKFDGVDIMLCKPHVDIDSSDDDLERLAEKFRVRNLKVGSMVAPIWPNIGGGSAMGSREDRAKFATQVRKSCRIGNKMREYGVREYGVIRIDSGEHGGVKRWAKNPKVLTTRIADTFREAAIIAEGEGERLAAEGEICWPGMHSWADMLDLLHEVNMPHILGFQADLAHTLLYLLGYNAPRYALLQPGYSEEEFWLEYEKMVSLLRPWTIDFHVAQNDGTVVGSGTHDNTGKHCLPNDPKGLLNIPRCSGLWLQHASMRRIRHICWDGCMFPNETLLNPETWNLILRTMIDVRSAHGWS